MPADRPSIDASLDADEQRSLQREVRVIVDLLQNYHYSGRQFSDFDGGAAIEAFMRELDAKNLFFARDDVAFVQRRFQRTLKPVYVFRGDLQPAFEIFDLFRERVLARMEWIDERVKRPFSFSREEDDLPRPAASTPAITEAEIDQRWERELREEVLEEILAGRTRAEAVAELSRRWTGWKDEIDHTDALLVRERFLDVLLRGFDPHSGYFSAAAAREFELDMQGAATGPGLAITQRGQRCFVAAIQPGGPADLDGRIQTGDEIESLANGDGPTWPTAGQRFAEIAARLRGEPATRLSLTVRRPGSHEHSVIQLERARLVQIANRARGGIWTVPLEDGVPRPIGWITLPAFYGAPEEAGAASATSDVRELLEAMIRDGIDGLVIDLRQNPGGLMAEATSLTGLFAAPARVVLTRGLSGNTTASDTAQSTALYNGPLVLLTSQSTASAAEVFSGALKFHHRAVLVGGRTTFGKGTLQTFVDFAKNPAATPDVRANWGLLRLTAQRFYLPDGTAVQRLGIPSDIVLNELDEPDFAGEAGLTLALAAENADAPADAVQKPRGFTPVNAELLEFLAARAATRISMLSEFDWWRRSNIWRRQARTFAAGTLLHAVREQQQTDHDIVRVALRQERRAMAATVAYPAKAVEIAAIREALTAHETAVRKVSANSTPRRGHLIGRTFYAERPDGGTMDVPIEAFDFRSFRTDAPILAAAFTEGSGIAMDVGEIEAALLALSLATDKDEAATIACVLDAIGETAADKRAEVARGVEAVLQRIAQLDASVLEGNQTLDVALREAARVAADWAAWTAAPSQRTE